MFNRNIPSVFLSMLLASLLLLQPIISTGLLTDYGDSNHVSSPSIASAKDLAQSAGGDVYLPVIANGEGQSAPATPTPGPTSRPTTIPATSPQFEISAPEAGQSISGYTFFAVQPFDAASITSVSFKVGDQDLGTDSDGSDGFQIFVNTDDLPTGPTEFTATVSGPDGSGFKSVTTQLVDAPTTSATIGEAGGVLASETGSVISILPNSVPEGTTITVDELTQEETTERQGIDWDQLGVTFLGAQDIQPSEPLERPIAMVASAGFGNRVQPGQVVVNYQLAPDADGDGVAEIVVVNGASIAPNGDVLSDPVERAVVEIGATVPEDELPEDELLEEQIQSASRQQEIGGAPGAYIDVRVQGFNLFSPDGNIATFRSTVDDTTVRMVGNLRIDPADSAKQRFAVSIPYALPPGQATISMQNLSTGMTTEPITITVQALPELTRSSKAVFDDAFALMGTLSAELEDLVAQDEELNDLAGFYATDISAEIAKSEAALDEIYALLEEGTFTEVRRVLDDAAKMIEVSGVLNDGGISAAGMAHMGAPLDDCVPPSVSPAEVRRRLGAVIDSALGMHPGGGIATNLGVSFEDPGKINPVGAIKEAAFDATGELPGAAGAMGTLTDGFLDSFGFTKALKDLFQIPIDALEYVRKVTSGECNDQPKPKPNRPNPPIPSPPQRRGPTTGMGAAFPPGGNGFGFSAGGGSRLRAVMASENGAAQQELARTAVKILVNNQATPFTGYTDDGGYFFVPFIPAGEPFAAVAVDTLTGETRTFEGIGPATGAETFLFFDFNNVGVTSAVTWDGGGDGISWSDPLNWTTDSVPTAADQVEIAPADVAQTVRITDTISIVSLQSAVPISVTEGSLTVVARSTLSSTLQMDSGTDLIASGLGATIDVLGGADFASTNLYALDGGQIRITGAGQYNGNASNDEPKIEADGPNSVIDLSGLTQLSGSTRTGAFGFGLKYLHITAKNGGIVNVSQIDELQEGRIYLTVDGAGSQADFDSFTALQSASTLQIQNQGALQMPNLERMQFAVLKLDGVSPTFPALQNIDAAAFSLVNGSQLALPLVTEVGGNSGAVNTDWLVRGVGSKLDLSATQVITPNTFVNATLRILVDEGGALDFSNLANIAAGNVLFTADGAGSLVDLSSLPRYIHTVRADAGFTSRNQGHILIPQLTQLSGVQLTLNATSMISTSQIISFTGGRIDVSGVDPDLSGIQAADGTRLVVRDGGRLSLPSITNYAGDGGGFSNEMQAIGTGSVLDLSTVTTLAGNTFVNDQLRISATEGGRVDLSNVPEITVGMIQFLAADENSTIDLSALTRFTKTSQGTSSLEARDSGTILAQQLAEIEGVEVIAETGAVLLP